MKILNLYAGIGGNRSLWGDEHDITAVEYMEDIAKVYCDRFPNDKMIITDAHEYLLNNYMHFDFIWSSPPCPSHSRIRFGQAKTKSVKKELVLPVYPDMKLYQEIILLQKYYEGLFCVENVTPYYEPLIKPSVTIDRHLFWSNFNIPVINIGKKTTIEFSNNPDYEKLYNISISKYKFKNRKTQILRNCVNPETGLHILNCAKGIYEYRSNNETISIFD